MLVANVLEAFTEHFSIRYYHVNVVFLIVVWFVVVGGVVNGVVFDFQSLKSQGGISAPFKGPHYNLVEAWYSREQYIGLKEDKLSSTTVDFIRSEWNLETKRLYWLSKPKMC